MWICNESCFHLRLVCERIQEWNNLKSKIFWGKASHNLTNAIKTFNLDFLRGLKMAKCYELEIPAKSGRKVNPQIHQTSKWRLKPTLSNHSTHRRWRIKPRVSVRLNKSINLKRNQSRNWSLGGQVLISRRLFPLSWRVTNCSRDNLSCCEE